MPTTAWTPELRGHACSPRSAGCRRGDRDVVVLVAWEELSYEEVAATLEIPVGTVRSRLNRARRMLRELLDDIRVERMTITSEPQADLR